MVVAGEFVKTSDGIHPVACEKNGRFTDITPYIEPCYDQKLWGHEKGALVYGPTMITQTSISG
jgi:hypothetical protein